jgi:hypothetical protein
MRTIPFGIIVNKSIDRAAIMLFKPFSLKKWFCLLFIAWLAGALGGGGNFNSANSNRNDSDKSKRSSTESSALGQEQEGATYNENQLSRDLPDQLGVLTDQEPDSKWGDIFKGRSNSKIIIIVFAGLLGLGMFLALLLFLTWISSRFKFIWFNAVVNNDASINEPFGRYKREGNSLFKFFIAWTLSYLTFIGLIIFWVYSAGSSAGIFVEGANPSFFTIVGALALPILTALVVIFCSLVVMFFIDQVVITVMAMDKCFFKEAWRKSLSILKANLKDFVLYFLLSMGLGILCSIIVIFIMFLIILLLLLIGGIIAGILYLLIVSIFKAKAIFIALAIMIGIPILLAALVILIAVNLPFAIFFKNFSLYFLSSLDCGYKPLPFDDFQGETSQESQ